MMAQPLFTRVCHIWVHSDYMFSKKGLKGYVKAF